MNLLLSLPAKEVTHINIGYGEEWDMLFSDTRGDSRFEEFYITEVPTKEFEQTAIVIGYDTRDTSPNTECMLEQIRQASARTITISNAAYEMSANYRLKYRGGGEWILKPLNHEQWRLDPAAIDEYIEQIDSYIAALAARRAALENMREHI